ncbi:MAG: hypothetical protein ACK526_03690 [Planctomyces sp.]
MKSRNHFNQTTAILAFAMASLFPLTGSAQDKPAVFDNDKQTFDRRTDNVTSTPVDVLPPYVDQGPEKSDAPKDQPPRFEPVPDEAFLDREPAWSSEEDQSRPSRPTRRPLGTNTQSPMRAREVRRTVVQTVYEPIPAEELAAAKKLQEGIALLKSAKDDESRKSATAIIQEQLNSQFDRDVEQREKELVEVEQRVKTLREQLDKRKSLRDDIIGLRLKTIQNDAEGLGFPGGESTGRSLVDAGAYPPGGHTFEPDRRRRSDDMFDSTSDEFRRSDEKTPLPAVDDGRDKRVGVETDSLFEDRLAGDDRESQFRLITSLGNQRDRESASAAFKQIRDTLAQIEANSPSLRSPSRDAQSIVEWSKDRSKENGKLQGFALLRWHYGTVRWTEILEAVRELDPALASETDALMAAFLKPEAEASTDNQKQKVGDDLFDESPRR